MHSGTYMNPKRDSAWGEAKSLPEAMRQGGEDAMDRDESQITQRIRIILACADDMVAEVDDLNGRLSSIIGKEPTKNCVPPPQPVRPDACCDHDSKLVAIHNKIMQAIDAIRFLKSVIRL